MSDLIPLERIENKILLIRGRKVLLAYDLAGLYGVPTKRLNEQVKRNIKRFPDDFMFQLTQQEFANLKSQFATSSWGGRRIPPYAFTEQGVAMLSSVLNSEQAIQVNIAIMRAFVKMREMLLNNAKMAAKHVPVKSAAADKEIVKYFKRRIFSERFRQITASKMNTEIERRISNVCKIVLTSEKSQNKEKSKHVENIPETNTVLNEASNVITVVLTLSDPVSRSFLKDIKRTKNIKQRHKKLLHIPCSTAKVRKLLTIVRYVRLLSGA